MATNYPIHLILTALRYIKIAAILFLTVGLQQACTVIQPSAYFKKVQRDTSIASITQTPGELKIKNGDVLSITISSMNISEDMLYAPRANSVSAEDGQGTQGFQVSSDGLIFIHNLGKIKVVGLTRRELKALLEERLIAYLKDPLVTINFQNHHVTVLGEVARPHLFPIYNEKLSIVELMAQSGLVSATGKLDEVTVIREKGGGVDIKKINLEDYSIFNSPYYYMQPNDVVVVGQNERLITQQAKQDKYRQYSSIIFQTLSIAIIIYQAFFRR